MFSKFVFIFFFFFFLNPFFPPFFLFFPFFSLLFFSFLTPCVCLEVVDLMWRITINKDVLTLCLYVSLRGSVGALRCFSDDCQRRVEEMVYFIVVDASEH